LWSYFALYWVGKLDTPYVVGTLSVFILQGIAAIAGKSLGKPRDEPKQPRDEPKQEPRPKQ
jgi:hypothetical protein